MIAGFVAVLMFLCGWLFGYYLGRTHGGRDTMHVFLQRMRELKEHVRE